MEGEARRAPVPGPLGRLASRVYARGLARRTARFDRGEGVVRFDRPVISVGNLSVGGTGKTPMVRWAVRTLRDAGHDPCVAMRGYKSREGHSDEATEHAEEFDDLPVVAQADRSRGLIELFASERGERVEAIVLDDGFQHRQIARDMDLVLLDATRDPFDDAMLPAGWLREPVEALRRATHIVLTHAEAASSSGLSTLAARIADFRGHEPDAVVRHVWTGLTIWRWGGSTWEATAESVEWLRERRTIAACALGNPGPFIDGAQRASGMLAAKVVLRDHDPYASGTIERIVGEARAAGAGAIVTTAKDWVKLRRCSLPLPVAVPRLELVFDSGEAAIRGALLAAVAEPE